MVQYKSVHRHKALRWESVIRSLILYFDDKEDDKLCFEDEQSSDGLGTT